MTPQITTSTDRLHGDTEHRDWAEGSHSEDRMPQYNTTNIASAQEVDHATAVGDQDLYDMILNKQYTGGYPQKIPLELEKKLKGMDETVVSLGHAQDVESFEVVTAAMADRIFSGPLDNIDGQAATDETLAQRELTEAHVHLVGQGGSGQHDPVSRWIPALPGYPSKAAAGQQPGVSPLSNYPETLVSYDNSDWVDVSTGSTNLDRDTQGLGSMFSNGYASYSDELELD